MLTRVASGACWGVRAHDVDVEVDVAVGLPTFQLVGLSVGGSRDSQVRISAALRNSGFDVPLNRRVVVNLAPATTRTEGTHFDLPIALGILAATGRLASDSVMGHVFAGEVALSGELRPIKGVLPLALRARERGSRALIVPTQNAQEVAWVGGLSVLGARSFGEVVGFLRGEVDLKVCGEGSSASRASEPRAPASIGAEQVQVTDLADVRGQTRARRALEIAAAGGHNLLMVGSPGAGKTMLASALPGLLPPWTFDEQLETSAIYSVAGFDVSTSLVSGRPFRSPHNNVSFAGMFGGGSDIHPGEVSLAHHGVLFLDEFPEFSIQVLEALRQPLESRSVSIVRVGRSVRYPAHFQLIAAMNPCRCGFLGARHRGCTCLPAAGKAYRSRVSGPLLDRFDLVVEVPWSPYADTNSAVGESSSEVRKRVASARMYLEQRCRDTGATQNADVSARAWENGQGLSSEAIRVLGRAAERLSLSMRGVCRIRRVARTIADLKETATIEADHVFEALSLRADGLSFER